MKLRKLLTFITLTTLLVGCEMNRSNQIEVEESKDPFVIQLFYSKTCPHCKQLKEELLPAIEEEFGSQVTIEQYDIDEDESVELYDTYIGLYDSDTDTWEVEGMLEGVDEEIADHNRYIPFMVIGDYYAFMGYTQELKDAYIQDIHLALQNRNLASGDVSNGRWLFKK